MIEVQQLTIKTKEATLVRDVSFKLTQGKVLGVVGESGSGKTMTAMALVNLLPEGVTSSGSISYHGKELKSFSKEELRRLRGEQIGVIMQRPMIAFNPVRTIERHFIETIRAHQAVSKRQAKAIAEANLEKMGLLPVQILSHYPFQLSGGMLQRIMMAMTLALEPAFIIADEPTTALDTTNQLTVLKELKAIVEQTNVGMLFVSHDLAVIQYIADEIAVMYNGFIVEQAPLTTLIKSAKHPYTKRLLQAEVGQGISEKLVKHIVQYDSCPYFSACSYAQVSCQSLPPLVEVTPHHQVRCIQIERGESVCPSSK
ncbi:ABC transporter ATP-binding protein [Sporosarcina sp. P13]|uniref:ABC transporter ATP-binding protein n=1 Tax=Sporosarcina sp. P13 TaxID=2048263 RepID=UPI0013044375|nr:ABC transporter ATP-binding protein [Sporosarcina sp. P13]